MRAHIATKRRDRPYLTYTGKTTNLETEIEEINKLDTNTDL